MSRRHRTARGPARCGAATAVAGVLLAFATACTGGSGEDPAAPGDTSTSAASQSPRAADTGSTAAAPEYCVELYEFLVSVNTFDNDGYGNSPFAEPMSADQLAAEADRLAQWATDLQAAVPPDLADALSVLSAALADIGEGFAGGLENGEAMLPMRDAAIEEARAVIGDASTAGDCAASQS